MKSIARLEQNLLTTATSDEKKLIISKSNNGTKNCPDFLAQHPKIHKDVIKAMLLYLFCDDPNARRKIVFHFISLFILLTCRKTTEAQLPRPASGDFKTLLSHKICVFFSFIEI